MAQFSGIVLVLGAKYPGTLEELTVKAERLKEIAGIVGQTRALGNRAFNRDGTAAGLEE